MYNLVIRVLCFPPREAPTCGFSADNASITHADGSTLALNIKPMKNAAADLLVGVPIPWRK